MAKKVLIVSDDKITRKCIYILKKHCSGFNKISIVLDCSTNILRVFKLVVKGKLSFQCLYRIVLAEVFRKNYSKFAHIHKIHTNEDLFDYLQENQPDTIFLFRVGLIINKKNLSTATRFLNIHCASIPEYRGLCSIYRALKNKAYCQKACLHAVTTEIDDPRKIVDYEPYKLDPQKPYFVNEDKAYEAGIRLLMRNLEDIQ